MKAEQTKKMILGTKCGMTRVFNGDVSVPVTVVHVPRITVVDKMTMERNGYTAVKVTYGEKNADKLNVPTKSFYKKVGVEPGIGFKEFRVSEADVEQFNVGDEINAAVFADQKFVDVQGTSIGKGFAGVVKRHNFRTQDATHGNSLAHRAPGSIGQNQTPGRVFKGKKMAGQLGNTTCTVQNLEVVKVDVEKNIILLKGAVPGSKSSQVLIKQATKKQEEGK